MVSMIKSISKALEVIKYTMIWIIIGLFIDYVGFYIILNKIKPIIFNIMNQPSLVITPMTIVGFILLVVGTIITSLGFIASFMKVNTELILEEIQELNYIRETSKIEPEYEEYICNKCGNDILKSDKFCKHCGDSNEDINKNNNFNDIKSSTLDTENDEIPPTYQVLGIMAIASVIIWILFQYR